MRAAVVSFRYDQDLNIELFLRGRGDVEEPKYRPDPALASVNPITVSRPCGGCVALDGQDVLTFNGHDEARVADARTGGAQALVDDEHGAGGRDRPSPEVGRARG